MYACIHKIHIWRMRKADSENMVHGCCVSCALSLSLSLSVQAWRLLACTARANTRYMRKFVCACVHAYVHVGVYTHACPRTSYLCSCACGILVVYLLP